MIFKSDENSLKEAAFSMTKKLIEPNLTFNKEATEKKKLAVMEDNKPDIFPGAKK